MPRHPGGYDTWLFTDAFIKDSQLIIVTMVYVDMPRDLNKVVLRSPLLPGGEVRGFTRVHTRDAYESIVVATYEHPSLAKIDRLPVTVEFEGHTQELTLLRAPGGWESGFAMCALFLQDRHLLRMWTAYWYLLGVDAFYLYWNGSPADIPALAATIEDLPASVTFVHWPFDYWVPDVNRPHHGQPQAWNSCYHRNKDRHDFLAFYDLDELLVFRNHSDLSSFYRSIPQPWVAMRSQSAWAKIDLDGMNVSYDALQVGHVAAAPLERAPVHYSREKYIMNASSGVAYVNVHGIYDACPTGLGVPGQPLKPENAGSVWPEPQLLMDESVAYHFHFVNVGRDRSRAKYIADPIVDDLAAKTVTRLLDTPRGRAWQRKVAQREAALALAEGRQPQPAGKGKQGSSSSKAKA